MNSYHKSVLLQEAITALQIEPGKNYIDATLGGGGHTRLVLEKGGIVLGIDQDDDALRYVGENFTSAIEDGKLVLVHGNFGDIARIAKENNFTNIFGVLFDIGVSSHQLDEGTRGFSFLSDSALDMRMDRNLGVTAADLVNGLTKPELIELFTKYGEEVFAKKIAEAIVVARLQKPITTTKELADLIAGKVAKIGKIHPATKVFQALRIAVNDELNSLKNGLEQAIQILEKNGRLVVISFHSLEDRIVKHTFEEFERERLGEIITIKPTTPTEEEILKNNRARSAKMRVFAKK
ncbi:MAG TPA: 16S rRNA (cytosine(1402)-N(4))-methyltransferase RsmH [Patescibacteria group bacterium]|nr:16S rRNA (cytosine(1402)-N(4))-methyltransferase RsmH [Patescibacteria group bacterium]